MATKTPYDFDSVLKEAETRRMLSPEQVQQLKQVHKEHVLTQEISIWENDPQPPAEPIQVPVPNLDAQDLAIKITNTAPNPAIYQPGSEEFRYWSAASALRRAADYWHALLPPDTKWQVGPVLPVHLDEGIDLNAFYDRQSLSFFHDKINGITVYSGESPDVICHELGHAVLDALRPDFWDIASDEIAAFHESFGDISAILSSLQLESMRVKVLDETNNHFYRSSRLSRLAEQLGWAIRQIDPQAVDSDCLRSAINHFYYQDPTTLPPIAPASALSSEPHSFSRIFTGTFFAVLAGMLAIYNSSPGEADLLQVSKDAGKILIEAIRLAPAVADFYSQVAAHMIEADKVHFNGKYGSAIINASVRHGLLSLESASTISSRGTTPITAAMNGRPEGANEPSLLALSVANYGLRQRTLAVRATGEIRRLPATAAAPTPGSAIAPSAERAARSFVEDLLRRGKIDTAGFAETGVGAVYPARIKKTHKLAQTSEGALTLVRTLFDCGF